MVGELRHSSDMMIRQSRRFAGAGVSRPLTRGIGELLSAFIGATSPRGAKDRCYEDGRRRAAMNPQISKIIIAPTTAPIRPAP